MKLKIFAGLVAAFMVASAIPLTNVGVQIATQQPSDSPTPIEAELYDGSGELGSYIKVGHVEVVYYHFGVGHITATAYQTSITLSDDDNDGTVKTTVGVDYAIRQPFNKTKHVLILFGIWLLKLGELPINRAIGSKLVTTTSSGWTYGEVLATFICPTSELSPEGTKFITHVRALCFIDYDGDTAPFTVYLGTYNESHQNFVGPPSPVDVKIEYPTGTMIASNVVSVTAGNNIGEYYLHTVSGETYRIDDTIPAYLID